MEFNNKIFNFINESVPIKLQSIEQVLERIQEHFNQYFSLKVIPTMRKEKELRLCLNPKILIENKVLGSENSGPKVKGIMFDQKLLEQIRAAFPRAVADYTGRKRAFFDNGTGCLVVGRAARAEAKARIDYSANVDGIFNESKKANEVIHNGRQAVADLLNAPSPDTIVSGESATALFFNISYGIGKELTGKENVVTTDYEHYANVSPWEELGKRGKIQQVRHARLNKAEGTLDMDHLQELIDANTKVVTVTAASNMLGTKSPLDEIGNMAREVGAYFIVDA
ncbi:MAG: aminotransferase class V-fold PLP-dependent enzyme, partial [Candidatus Hodarchaeota archaeon]